MDATANHTRAKTVTRGWHWRQRDPAIVVRVIALDIIERGRRAERLATEKIDKPIHFNPGNATPTGWHLGALTLHASRHVIDFIGSQRKG